MLEQAEALKCLAVPTRGNDAGANRADIQVAVTEACPGMAAPDIRGAYTYFGWACCWRSR